MTGKQKIWKREKYMLTNTQLSHDNIGDKYTMTHYILPPKDGDECDVDKSLILHHLTTNRHQPAM
uniref:Uncharacterized protein n=1 Tax=Arundo donax TaxID=35708 RepID=A0A0A9A1C7_ARUDO